MSRREPFSLGMSPLKSGDSGLRWFPRLYPTRLQIAGCPRSSSLARTEHGET
jgi:hypothetical protein